MGDGAGAGVTGMTDDEIRRMTDAQLVEWCPHLVAWSRTRDGLLHSFVMAFLDEGDWRRFVKREAEHRRRVFYPPGPLRLGYRGATKPEWVGNAF